MATTEMFTTREECDCWIRILEVRQEALGLMDDVDARREGDYETVADYRKIWEAINGEGSWDPEKVVDVVSFEYVGRSP